MSAPPIKFKRPFVVAELPKPSPHISLPAGSPPYGMPGLKGGRHRRKSRKSRKSRRSRRRGGFWPFSSAEKRLSEMTAQELFDKYNPAWGTTRDSVRKNLEDLGVDPVVSDEVGAMVDKRTMFTPSPPTTPAVSSPPRDFAPLPWSLPSMGGRHRRTRHKRRGTHRRRR